MNQYFFVLGTNHTLCKVDIVNALLKKGLVFEIIEASEETLIIQTETGLEAEKLINELGSAAKIGEIFRLYEKNEFSANSLKSEFGGEKLGVSVYNAGGKLQQLDKIFRQTRSLGGIWEKGRVLSTVAVDKKNLLHNGLELVICVGSKGVYLGKTLAIQDYESYSLRDYGRPDRDSRSGMIPPKLAKIMINLAGKEEKDLFLDPFCGSGTILQELILLGYKNITGTDIEDKAVSDSQKNLEWLFETYKLKKEDFKIDIFKSDARVLSEKISKNLVDVIVTEPFLGSSQARNLSLGQIKKEIQKLEGLYLEIFKEFKKILKENGRIVIVFPVFKVGNQFLKLQILEALDSLGFKRKSFIETKINGEELLKLQITERGSVVYFRPGQSVSREIFVYLTKNIT